MPRQRLGVNLPAPPHSWNFGFDRSRVISDAHHPQITQQGGLMKGRNEEIGGNSLSGCGHLLQYLFSPIRVKETAVTHPGQLLGGFFAGSLARLDLLDHL